MEQPLYIPCLTIDEACAARPGQRDSEQFMQIFPTAESSWTLFEISPDSLRRIADLADEDDGLVEIGPGLADDPSIRYLVGGFAQGLYWGVFPSLRLMDYQSQTLALGGTIAVLITFLWLYLSHGRPEVRRYCMIALLGSLAVGLIFGLNTIGPFLRGLQQ